VVNRPREILIELRETYELALLECQEAKNRGDISEARQQSMRASFAARAYREAEKKYAPD